MQAEEEKKETSFKTVYRSQENYLQNDKNYVIYLTIFKNPDDPRFEEMINWCKINVKGSFSIALNENTNYYLTVRIWNEESRKKFVEKYSDFIQGVL